MPYYTVELQSAGGTVSKHYVTASTEYRAVTLATRSAKATYPDTEGWRPLRIDRA